MTTKIKNTAKNKNARWRAKARRYERFVWIFGSRRRNNAKQVVMPPRIGKKKANGPSAVWR
jgi:hypothetical protein